jgi:hypothetical protein
MSWASRRQFQYISGLLIFLGLIGLIIAWPYITKAPTCTDGKQNGGERGVDCGGSCQRICNADASEPVILWYRAFPVTGSVYNLVAFVENRNKEAAIAQVSYEFRIYDTNNILIGRRQGKTFIPANQQFAIFESRFDSGASDIKSVNFDFTSPFVWLKKKPVIQTLPIRVDEIIMSEDKSSPSLTARINNDSIYDLPSFDVVALLYDIKHNVINASKTHKEGLDTNQNSLLLFTWPNPLTDDPATKDILVQVNPFTTPF